MIRSIRALAWAAGLLALSGCSGDMNGAVPPPEPASASGNLAHTGSSGGGTDGDGNVYTVAATVSGLTGAGLALTLNAGQPLPVSGNGSVTFPGTLANGATYAVKVQAQPSTAREVCGISNATGTIGGANVTVTVNCANTIGFLYQAVFGDQLLSYGITPGSGAPVPIGTAFATDSNPTAMITSPGGNFLLVSQSPGTQSPGSVSVYAVNADTGALTEASSVVTAGLEPTSMALSAAGLLFVFGSIPTQAPVVPPISAALAVYAFDASTGALTPTGTSLTFPAGTGTGFAVTPDGKFLYVLNGDFDSNTPLPITLTAYAIDSTTGGLTAGPVTTFMSDVLNSNTVVIDPLGRFLYLTTSQTTPGAVSISTTILPYAIDSATGALTASGTGTSVASNASGFSFDPSGHYLYLLNNFNYTAADDSVLALAVDQSSGVLSPIGSPLPIADQPFQITCDPSGEFVYVGTGGIISPNNLAAFAISTTPSTAGQLVLSGQIGSPETIALAVVE